MQNKNSTKIPYFRPFKKTRGSMVFFTLDLYGTVLFKYHTFSDFALVSIFIGDFPTVYL
jgi:hypothetical protein